MAYRPLPQWDTARPAVGTHGGSTFAVTKDSRDPEAAMEFIAWQVSTPTPCAPACPAAPAASTRRRPPSSPSARTPSTAPTTAARTSTPSSSRRRRRSATAGSGARG
ncbi:extracellular solute-binding protein [Streptomyces thermocarboxydus]